MGTRSDVTLKLHDFATVRLCNPPEGIADLLRLYFANHIADHAEDTSCHGRIKFGPGSDRLPDTFDYVSRRAAFDKERFYVIDNRGNRLSFRAANGLDMTRIDADEEFSPEFFVELLELVFHFISLSRSGVFLHSSAIEVNGKAVVICGWANIGKTESLIELLRRGNPFMGDDWTILSPGGRVYAYLKAAELYRHDLLMSPHILRDRYGWRAKYLISYLNLLQPSKIHKVRPGFRNKIRRRVLRKTVNLLKVHTEELTLDPTEISPAGLTMEAPLGVVFLLTRSNVDQVEFYEADAATVAKRMTSVHAWATRLTIDENLLRFAFPFAGTASTDNFSKLMETTLQACLSHAPIYWVRVPVDCPPVQLVDRLLESVP